MSEADTGIVDIHGSGYKKVALRLKTFREDEKYAGYRIITKEIDRTENEVFFKAKIKDPSGATVATGCAREVIGSNKINKTSHYEVCETSAVGRALAFLGLLGTEIATEEDIERAKAAEAELDAQEHAEEVKPPNDADSALQHCLNMVGYDKKTEIATGTYIEADQAIEWLNAHCTPDVIKDVMPYVADIKEQLIGASSVEAA
jgi:hypothetical protein